MYMCTGYRKLYVVQQAGFLLRKHLYTNDNTGYYHRKDKLHTLQHMLADLTTAAQISSVTYTCTLYIHVQYIYVCIILYNVMYIYIYTTVGPPHPFIYILYTHVLYVPGGSYIIATKAVVLALYIGTAKQCMKRKVTSVRKSQGYSVAFSMLDSRHNSDTETHVHYILYVYVYTYTKMYNVVYT